MDPLSRCRWPGVSGAVSPGSSAAVWAVVATPGAGDL